MNIKNCIWNWLIALVSSSLCFGSQGFEPLSIHLTNSRVRIQFLAQEGIHYRVQQNIDMMSTNWTTLSNILGSNVTTYIDLPISKRTQYYKLAHRRKPLFGKSLYASPGTAAAEQAKAWKTVQPTNAAKMQRMAEVATAEWFGDWVSDVKSAVNKCVTNAHSSNQLPIVVAYNIPLRDCGHFSSGGAASTDEYIEWITAFADGISTNEAVVILEPDALAAMDCLRLDDQIARLHLLYQTVIILKERSNAFVYLDAGHAKWKTVHVMVTRLNAAGIRYADGFSLNVSNFIADNELITYGSAISSKLGDIHFVIDTGRNGLGPTANLEWCNPPGRALGKASTTDTGHPLIDMFAWIKEPGRSDGECNGGPSAGTWWPEYALGLAERAGY